MLPIIEAQKKISSIWSWGGGVVIVMLISQTLFGKYGNDYWNVIGWFSQIVLPTWGIIFGTLVYTQKNPQKFKTKRVESFYFRLCRNISVFYFIITLSIIFLQPAIFSRTGLNGLEVLTMSSYFLVLLQGILNTILGIFFLNQNN